MNPKTVDDCKILIGTFVIHLLILGSARLSSILFVESITYYNTDRNQASFPFVLSFLTRHLLGPLIGYLEQIFGLQRLVIFGGITAALGIGGCYFATDILTVTILWGVIFGSSSCLTCQVLPVCLNRHFKQHRNKAMGFYFAGQSVGCLIVPALVEACLYYYGMAASFLVLSALVANTIPAALLLNYSEKQQNLKNDKNQIPSVSNLNTICGSVSVINMKQVQQLPPSIPSRSVFNKSEIKSASATSRKHCNLLKYSTKNPDCYVSYNEINVKEKVKAQRTLGKYNFSLENFSIFIDHAFIGILVFHAFSNTIVVSFWTIILDLVRDKGIEESQEFHFILCLPVAELLGRLVCGYLFDKSSWATSTLSFIMCTCTAVSLTAFNFVNGYILLLICEAAVSFFTSGMILLQVGFAHKFVEEKKQVMAMTCRFILFAPLSLLISPMIGYFRGTSGSYNSIIYILSAGCIFCGLISCVIPYLSKIRNKT